MKLEELLGAELYAQVQTKLDEVNGKEPDKLKHVRYADLSEGEYVGKGKHDALQAKFDSQAQELASANQLITELKKGTTGNEELQGKITGYETQVLQLQQELHETKIKSAVKVALLSEKATDVDYLTYKLETQLKADGKHLELDDADNIKGWDTLLSGLKTQYPNWFEGEGDKRYKDSSLPNGGGGSEITLEQFRKMGVEERSKLKAENESLYNEFKGK